MTVLGNRRVNPNPCNETEMREAIRQIAEFIDNPDVFFENINLVNLTYTPTTNTLEVGAGAGIDTFKVKVSAADTLEEYLHDSMKDAAVFDADVGEDVLVYGAIADPAANEKLRIFVDVSTAPGYEATGTVVWTHQDNVWTLQNLDTFTTNLFNSITLVGLTFVGDTLTATGAEKYRLVRGKCVDPVIADDVAFYIYEIDPLAGGNDPSNGDPQFQLLVRNIHRDAYDRGEYCVAAWNDDVLLNPEVDWEALPKQGQLTDQESGLFLAELSVDISPGSVSSLTPGDGDIYAVGKGGNTTHLGGRRLFNPFPIRLPATAAGTPLTYACARTYRHNPDLDETEEDDEYTVHGLDPLHILASLPGYADEKILWVGDPGDEISVGLGWSSVICVPGS